MSSNTRTINGLPTNPAYAPINSNEGISERFNSISHLVGAVLALIGTAVLVSLAGAHGEATRIVSFSVYGFTLFLLYLFSTLYHSPCGEGGRNPSLVIYLTMGWLIVLALDPIIAALPPAGFRLLVAGGLFYTVGVIFYVLANVWPWCHGIWDLFVLAGSVSH
jgi:hemolysin III